ncbi:MAG: ABC-F family ATP-binding cassette domain-containing protein, partial [Bacteroidota bacterium]
MPRAGSRDAQRMNYLSVESLSRWYGERVLFEGLSFGLSRGDKVALIANNGTGKSSLMHILAGKDTPDTGTVTYREGVKVGFLAQEPELDNTLTIAALIQQANADVVAASREYEAALAAQSEHYSEETQKAFDRASARMDELGAWDYERQLRQILTRFNITDHDQVVGNLSGGQRKRLALALVLLDKPELLVLDEPTNHLDIVMIEWLEKYLTQANITLLMVTHDRYFLDKVCNHILELSDGKLFHHKGNYAYFLEKRVEREASYDTEVGKAKKLMKKELEWMRRSPQARTTKSKARINAFYETQDKATSRKVKQELRLQVKMNRIGGKILEMKKVYKAYGELPILQGFDYTFKRGERVGIIGPNGVGK